MKNCEQAQSMILMKLGKRKRRKTYLNDSNNNLIVRKILIDRTFSLGIEGSYLFSLKLQDFWNEMVENERVDKIIV